MLAAMYLKGEATPGELAVITTQQAEEADYNLSPSRWVEQNGNAEVDSIPNLLHALEQLNEQDVSITSDLLRLLRPLAKTEDA
jgi:type I restriction enzyme M protein